MVLGISHARVPANDVRRSYVFLLHNEELFSNPAVVSDASNNLYPKDTVVALVEGGAHMDFRNRESYTPVHRAASRGKIVNHRLLRPFLCFFFFCLSLFLLSLLQFVSPFLTCSLMLVGAFKSLKMMLDLGASPDFRDAAGQSSGWVCCDRYLTWD